jgi:protein TonB
MQVAQPLGAQELSIEREVPGPPPPPEPELPPPPPPDPPKWVANVIAQAPELAENPTEAPSSEAAQAGEVLVQDSDDEEDDEDEDNAEENTFVTGDAGTYAGGMTASGGTSQLAVRGTVVADGGVPGGTGTLVMSAPKPKARDLSRRAWLDGNTSWDDCDFPGEADRDRIRDAIVEMSVAVRPDGTPQSVAILEDPGHGFARTALACALKHKFAPALDAEGRRIAGTTGPFHVGFHR